MVAYNGEKNEQSKSESSSGATFVACRSACLARCPGSLLFCFFSRPPHFLGVSSAPGVACWYERVPCRPASIS